MIDKSKVDLTKPAFGPEAQTIAEVSAEKPQEETLKPKEDTEESKEKETVAEEVPDEKPRVTYSRFQNVHKRALDAEREAAEWKAKAEQLEQAPHKRYEEPSDAPDNEWVKLFGDTPESKEAWKIQQQREERLLSQAEERALVRLAQKQQEEQVKARENLTAIDEHLEEVSAFAGRDLTEKEQSAVLDIIDDYTPKDASGNYLGAMISPDKAWEIYEMKHERANASKKQSRDNVASLSGANSQGEASLDKAEQDKNFNPLDWNSWMKKVK